MAEENTHELESAYAAGDFAAWDRAVVGDDVEAAEAILEGMMPRCRSAIETVVQRLESIGCPVQRQSAGSQPLLIPVTNLDELLEPIVARGWRIPLSLQTFWEHVGGIIIGGDYPDYTHLDFWRDRLALSELPYTDALWIEPPDAEMIKSDIERSEDAGAAELVIAPDALHKDNVSGGPPYSVPLDAPNTIEPLLANFPGDGAHPGKSTPMKPMGLVAYLRFAVLHAGGFPGLTVTEEYDQIRRGLVEGLEPF